MQLGNLQVRSAISAVPPKSPIGTAQFNFGRNSTMTEEHIVDDFQRGGEKNLGH